MFGRLSFSTLGCPDWDFRTIVVRARQYGFRGIGVRGIQGEMVLNRIPEFGEGRRAETLKLLDENGIEIMMMLGSSKFTSPDKGERQAQVRAAKDDIDIAVALRSSKIRVFGGAIPEGVKKDDAYQWVVECLKELGDYGGRKGVVTCIETHDDFTDTYLVKDIIERTDHEYVRVLWDVHHPYRTCGQSMQEAYDNIGPYAVDTHFKDSNPAPDTKKGHKYTLLGEGDVPNREALSLLAAGGYEGYLTLEWEKKWEPYLPEPMVGFPQYVQRMNQYLTELE